MLLLCVVTQESSDLYASGAVYGDTAWETVMYWQLTSIVSVDLAYQVPMNGIAS